MHDLGQDESVYSAFSLSAFEWSVGGHIRMRHKEKGPGIHVSGFVSELLGFGLWLTDEQTAKVNSAECRIGKKEIDSPPGKVTLLHGKNRDGWWNLDKLLAQSLNVIETIGIVYDSAYQCFGRYDHSRVHTKNDDDAIMLTRMGVAWGGKRPVMHQTTITSECLGNEDMAMFYRPMIVEEVATEKERRETLKAWHLVTRRSLTGNMQHIFSMILKSTCSTHQ
jgi:hypothetical protein